MQTALRLVKAGTPFMVHSGTRGTEIGPFSDREYCLAAFLIVAGEFSFWGMGQGWGTDSFPWFPEFDRPLVSREARAAPGSRCLSLTPLAGRRESRSPMPSRRPPGNTSESLNI